MIKNSSLIGTVILNRPVDGGGLEDGGWIDPSSRRKLNTDKIFLMIFLRAGFVGTSLQSLHDIFPKNYKPNRIIIK